jgi:hypothetical protein
MRDITADGAPAGLLLEAPFGRGWICITPWPELQAWHRKRGIGLWQPMSDARLSLRRILRDARVDEHKHMQLPLFPELEPPIERRTPAEALAFFANIPLRARTAAFRFTSRQQSLLALAAAHPLGWELLDPYANGNPALAFGLAELLSSETNLLARRLILERTMEPRRFIARQLGFSGSRLCLAILSRIPPRHCTPRMLREMRIVLEHEGAVALLQQIPVVTPTAVALLLRRRLHGVLTPHFLHDVRREPPLYRGHIVAQVARYAERGVNGPGAALPPLYWLHELDSALARLDKEALPSTFSCPLPITQPGLAITPLTSIEAIEREAQEMQHCLTNYTGRIARFRDHFAYRVDAPERGTVLIERQHERWRVTEARGLRNRKLRPETIALVRAAVANAQRTLMAAPPRPVPHDSNRFHIGLRAFRPALGAHTLPAPPPLRPSV